MSGETTIRTASQWLAHWATITPDRPALVIEGQGSFRYAEWAIAVAQMARHLREMGCVRACWWGLKPPIITCMR